MKTLIACMFAGATAGLLLAQDPRPVPASDKPVQEKPAQDKQEPKQLQLGMRVQRETVLKDIDGKEHKAGSYMGKLTVVNFFSIQCPIQQAWDPTLAAIQREYEKKGVVFLNINSNHTEIGKEPPKTDGDAKPYDNVREYLKKKELPYTVLVDHGNVVADFFEARTTPDIFVFGTDGRLVYRGLIDDDQRRTKGDQAKRYLKDTLDKLLAGEKVEPFATTPQGCTIKRVDGGGRRAGGRRDGGGSGGE